MTLSQLVRLLVAEGKSDRRGAIDALGALGVAAAIPKVISQLIKLDFEDEGLKLRQISALRQIITGGMRIFQRAYYAQRERLHGIVTKNVAELSTLQ